MSDGGKGSKQRPGIGYADGWDMIFNKKDRVPKFEIGQHVVFMVYEDEKLPLDYTRDYVVDNVVIEKSPNGNILISLENEEGFYDENDFEEFDVWASHQKRVDEDFIYN